MNIGKKFLVVLGLLALLTPGLSVAAGEWDSVPAKKATVLKLYMHPKDAFDRVAGAEGTKTLFIDIRTPEEAMFVGMPTVADANVPYKLMPGKPDWDAKKNSFKLVLNDGFVGTTLARLEAKGLTKDDVVILMCRSGDRSAEAANEMAKAGFTRVYSILEGFEGDMSKEGRRAVNGWKNDGLPWTYELAKDKMSAL